MADASTLGGLLARRELRLRPIEPIPRGLLDAELLGVHSSDLPDPALFLDEGVALLTTGTQFDGSVSADAYVDRLVARGVAALGFGTDVVRPGLPEGLLEACRRTGLPLFEVPYRTPFIQVVRAHADAVAARRFARRSWALAAQRAVSLAALRADPLPATIGELARQLDAWAGLFDPAGALQIARPAPLAPEAASALADAARRMLDRGVRAAEVVACAGRSFTVQTLGRGGALRGVLAVEGERLDQEARGVITTVVAMAGFALERAAEHSRGQAALRAGVLRAWLAGDAGLADDVARAAWGGLPGEPVRVASLEGAPDEVLAFLDVRAEATPGSLFFAPLDDETVVVQGAAAGSTLEKTGGVQGAAAGSAALDGATVVVQRAGDGAEASAAEPATRAGRAVSGDEAPATDVAVALAERAGRGVGVSRPGSHARLAELLAEARAARPSAGAATYEPGAADVFGAPSGDQRAAAAALVAPLLRHDAAHGSDLAGDVEAWLAADASHERAAADRGVHRHTMRARIRQAGEILSLDLATFADRAALWAALRIRAG